jgi:hypothetical protein
MTRPDHQARDRRSPVPEVLSTIGFYDTRDTGCEFAAVAPRPLRHPSGEVVRRLEAADLRHSAMRVAAGLIMAFGHGLAKVPPGKGFVERIARPMALPR